MTPKEKADELVSKYYLQVETLEKQKECALIAVDEILSMGGHLNFDYAWVEHRPTDIKNWFDTNNSQVIKVNAFLYWVNVRKEIEKL
jgi:hypothetical protein